MSLFEKVCVLGSLGAVGVFSVYSIFGPSKNSLSSDEVQAKRNKLVHDENMRVLYSTMTFFYLQGFQQECVKSLHNLYDVLNISKPKLVAIQLSQKEYDEKYQPIIAHPQFPELMNRVDFLLQTKSQDVANMKELELKHLEKLYIFDYCKKNKCKVLFADKSPSDLRSMYQAKLQLSKFHLQTEESERSIPEPLKELYQEDLNKMEKVFKEAKGTQKHEQLASIEKQVKKEIYQDFRHEFYVDLIMEELTPKASFLPSSPYKTLVGLVEPEDLDGITKLWKNKFRATYGHEIIEDEDVLEARIAKEQAIQKQQLNIV